LAARSVGLGAVFRTRNSARSHRLALQLADPLVVNRFRLFAIWTGALFVLPATVLLTRIFLLASGQPAEDPARIDTVMTFVRFMILLTGGMSFSALWLSFFPPRFYIKKITTA
jgi:hypothetical protein